MVKKNILIIEEELKVKKERLAHEFQEISKNSEREEEIELWDTAMEDGLDAINAYNPKEEKT